VIAAVAYGLLVGISAVCVGIAFAPERRDPRESSVQGGAIIVAAVAFGALVALGIGGVG